MTKRYYAIRPEGAPNLVRIEKARTPQEACNLAFGKGRLNHWQWKDMGTRVRVIQTDAKRIALLRDPNNWISETNRRRP